ncbi:MAG: hypothetical protein CMM76_13645 [Rhodospirillaceae bacterium]|nr:hypothetical protein [Rhodospirillaceae bacterium]|tara:strand:- start:977 stop:1420 length:444 start_codon:yes stop_codon:yes gene_type:complete
MNQTLENVTDRPSLWEATDPVRPELDVEFKTATGRGVFGLLGDDGKWRAFLCYARTFLIPKDVDELERLTVEDGNVIIPYTVWSHEKGAGRAIINEVLKRVKDPALGIDRVVTLSPLTTMARKFHLRNNAKEFRMNETTVNFEYEIL